MAENSTPWPCRSKDCAAQVCAAQFSVDADIVRELGKNGLRWPGPHHNGTFCGATRQLLEQFGERTDLSFEEAVARTSGILTGTVAIEGNLPDPPRSV